jgi:hypothetical protein
MVTVAYCARVAPAPTEPDRRAGGRHPLEDKILRHLESNSMKSASAHM